VKLKLNNFLVIVNLREILEEEFQIAIWSTRWNRVHETWRWNMLHISYEK